MTADPTSHRTSPGEGVAERPPRPAATIVVVRDGVAGIEVLLSRRAERGDHNSNAWVFPGGLVDPGDRSTRACLGGLDDATASARLGVERDGLDYHVAAVRECFEESGLLYANDADGRPLRLDDGVRDAQIAAWRGPLHRGERTLDALCRAFGLTLALDRLVYLSHWLTPLGRAKRFDTRFFVAATPPGQTAAFDGTEMLEQLWIRPADALARTHELRLMTPTQKTLELVATHRDVDALLAWARAPRRIALIMPRVGTGREGPRPVMPDEPAFAELGRIDPAGHGFGSYEIEVDRPVRLSERVIRLTAGNGSRMTGPGTNTYLVGGGAANEWSVIDPGPADAVHLDAIVAAAPGPIRRIFVTHTHRDHSPGAAPLRARTGAQVHGRLPAHPEFQDTDFTADALLAGGERFALSGATLHAIHTPGHASNHLCYLLEEEKLLFTGDHVMQRSTVVINPPDGDMAAYLASVRALLDVDLEWLAPGHGFLIGDPPQALRAIVDHRLAREARVVDALAQFGPADETTLLAAVYADVSPHLHDMARRSLRAHLLKLRDEGRALERDAGWAPSDAMREGGEGRHEGRRGGDSGAAWSDASRGPSGSG